jgi:hypothetical protein
MVGETNDSMRDDDDDAAARSKWWVGRRWSVVVLYSLLVLFNNSSSSEFGLAWHALVVCWPSIYFRSILLAFGGSGGGMVYGHNLVWW